MRPFLPRSSCRSADALSVSHPPFLPQSEPARAFPVATAAPQPISDYPDHLSRAVADLVVSDDDDDEEEEAFAVTDDEDSDHGGW